MAELHHYDVTDRNGFTTTLRLTDADARKRGLTKKTGGTARTAEAPVTSKTTAGK